MRSLRARLFIAILGTVLVAVGASLALGIVLTKSAVRATISRDVERQAGAFAKQVQLLPAEAVQRLERQGQASLSGGQAPPAGAAQGAAGAGAAGAATATAAAGASPAEPAPTGAAGLPPAGLPPVRAARAPLTQIVLSSATAATLLPAEAMAALRRAGSVSGTTRLQGREQIYAARKVGDAVALAVRPDILTGGDFGRYLAGLLIASGAAALLAAAVAALLARRLTEPLRRLGGAARELAAGSRPAAVPVEGPTEVSELASAFNEMSDQLALARDAERGVLLSVSHDLRTPLTSIRGYAEGIEDGTVEPREGAGVLAREAARLERLVGDLLALARLRQGVLEVRREPVDLTAIAEEAAVRLRPRAAQKDVSIEVPQQPAAAIADHDRVLQVLTNLLDNAIRVSPAGGMVSVSAAQGTIAVSDRGPGLPETELPRAFERFHLRSRTGNGSPDGAGLGLAIVRELSEAMGGSVAVENLPEGGARFTVRLPAPGS
jgi:signal transduction histidine kinase